MARGAQELAARVQALVREARAEGAEPGAIAAVLTEAAAALLRGGVGAAEGMPGDGEVAARGTAAADTAVEHPAERVHRIRSLNSFTEMAALERAARYGWRLVGTGSGTVIVRKTDVVWEHQRVFASRSAGRALAAQGWEQVGVSWFPWAYYARPTAVPAAPEPADDDYLQRPPPEAAGA